MRSLIDILDLSLEEIFLEVTKNQGVSSFSEVSEEEIEFVNPAEETVAEEGAGENDSDL